MLTAAATFSRKLSSDSNSAFGSSCQRTRLASSGTHRPATPVHRPSVYPYRLQRCNSERGPDNDCVGNGFATAQYRSCAELDCHIRTLQSTTGASTFHPPPHRIRRHTTSHPTTINPLQRKDIFYSGSVVSLRGSTTLGGLHSRQNVDLAGVQVPEPVDAATAAWETPTRSRCGAGGGGGFSTLLVMLDVSLFRNSAFLVICASSAFIQLGYFVPVVFLTPYTQTLKLTTSDAALFLSVIGRYHVLVNNGFTTERKTAQLLSTITVHE